MFKVWTTLLASKQDGQTFFLVDGIITFSRAQQTTLKGNGSQMFSNSLIQAAEMARSLASVTRTKSLMKYGICKTGASDDAFLRASNISWCSDVHSNGTPFLFRACNAAANFQNSGINRA